MTKSVFASKTVWFNVIMTIIGTATALNNISAFAIYSPIFMASFAIGNVILRIWFTSQPIQ